MAVSRIWPVRGQLDHPIDYAKNPEKTKEKNPDFQNMQAMEDVMSYAVNEEKTEKKLYVSGINCNPDTARDQFVTVKKQFGKEGGIIAYHAYQSFSEGEVSARKAHDIGVEFAQRVWGEDYQVVVATHLNTKCFHNHFVVNSVSFLHGRRCRKKQWRDLRKISDEVCRQHSLSVIEEPCGKRIPIQIARAEKKGKSTRLIMAKEAIDEAIKNVSSMRELDIYLRKIGYTMQHDQNRKYWTIKSKAWERPIRLIHIGDDYSNDRIRQRVQQPKESFMQPFHAGEKAKGEYLVFTRLDKTKMRGGLIGLYYHYLYLLGYLPKRSRNHNSNRVHYLLRDDLIKLDKITAEVRLLGKHDIETSEQLILFKEKNIGEIKTLEEKRRKLRNEVRRKQPEAAREKVKEEISKIGEELKAIRKNIRLSESIEKRSLHIEEKLYHIEKEQSGKEERTNEFRR